MINYHPKFVCKDTLGGESTSVIIVDKENYNKNLIIDVMKQWINEPINKKHPGREWPYDGQKHKIIVEKYLEQSNGDLADYKFFCFNGKVEYFYVRTDYVNAHESAKMAFFTKNKKCLEGVGMNYCSCSKEASKLPVNIDEMMKYAEILAEDFPHVRVDFYNVDGKVYFGELTFYNASGYMKFNPDSFDYEIGRKFSITK